MSDPKSAQGDEQPQSEQELTLLQPSLPQQPMGGDTAPQQHTGLAPSPHTWESSLAPGQLLAGRYTLLQPLGQGGMGVVLAAYDSKLDRRVALKLPVVGSASSEYQSRLLREAQAMARLSHPNVVTVFDAGQLEDGRVFLAMEMVEGQTLRQWCRSQPRTWRQVLELYLAAGQGLAAAHAAGLVHRDFKPDNVLVGNDERVRVTDFGLARAEFISSAAGPQPLPTEPLPTEPLPTEPLPTEPPPTEPPPTESGQSPAGVWEAALTQPGMVPGTPKYLAAELLEGKPADARSDLFAFCVALYEALYGRPPFNGATTKERLNAQRQGRVSPPPPQAGVPAWVGKAVLRGLMRDAEQRPASMRALLELLSRDPARVRTRMLAWVASAVAVLGLVAGAAWAMQVRASERALLCQGAPQRLLGVWDEGVQARIRQAFLSLDKPYALDAFQGVQRTLQAYALDWASMHREACEATRLRGEQSEEVLTRRMACLERRRQQLGSLVEVLAQADDALVRQAPQAAVGLPSLHGCADLDTLLAEVPPPEDAATRQTVARIRQELDHAHALYLSRKDKESAQRAQAALLQARAVDYPPLLAEALLRLCVPVGRFDPQQAVPTCTEAAWTAYAHKLDQVVAEAGIAQLYSLYDLNLQEQARFWEGFTAAALKRTNGDMELMGRFQNALAAGYAFAGKFEQALEAVERARQLIERGRGPESLQVLSAENNLAAILGNMGREAQASQVMERVVQRFEKLQGPRHPGLVNYLANLAATQVSIGELAKAQRSLERAALILQQSKLQSPQALAFWSLTTCVLRLEQGRYPEALEHAQEALERFTSLGMLESNRGTRTLGAISEAQLKLGREQQGYAALKRLMEMAERALGSDNSELAFAWNDIALYHEFQGQHAKALQLRERAFQHAARLEGEEGAIAAQARLDMARSLLHVGRAQEALEQARLSHVTLHKLQGDRAGRVLLALRTQGEALLALGQPAQALALFEQALRGAEAAGLDPNVQARLRFLLARALAETGGSAERIASLVAHAQEDHARSPSPYRPHQQELARWARSRGYPLASR